MSKLVAQGLFYCPETPGGTPYLIGSRCLGCGTMFFPRRALCPRCLTENLEEVALSRRGKLDVFTVSYVALPGFEAPYVVGIVALPEGLKIYSLIDASGEELRPGMDVELVIDKIAYDEDGEELIGYKFRPVKGAR